MVSSKRKITRNFTFDIDVPRNALTKNKCYQHSVAKELIVISFSFEASFIFISSNSLFDLLEESG